MNINKLQKSGISGHSLWLKLAKLLPKLLLYAIMLGLAYIFLYPFIYMVITSVKSNADLSSMAGYSLARYKSFGHKFAFFFMILAMLVPPQTIIVPQYLLYANMGWLNSYLPLIIPSFFGFGLKGALFIYIFRQFFLSQPRELEEAARVDGCGFIRTFIYIIFPVARSIYIVVLVLALVWHWSDFFEPSMYINKSDMAMLSMRLQAISDTLRLFSADVLETNYGVTDTNTINNAVLMAGTFIVVLPVLLIYSLLQKQFIQGIERSGLTGE